MRFDLSGALGLAFSESPLPQWLFDPATLRILAVNRAAVELYSRTADEFLTSTIVLLHPPDEHHDATSALLAPLGQAVASDERTWRHVGANGERVVKLAIADLAVEGRAMRLVQALDVTAAAGRQHQYEEAARRESDARRRAEAASLAKEELIATVGHELRQPLGPVLMALSLMERRVSQEVGVRAREVIKRQVGLLNQLVDDLLDTARLQQGKVALRRETHDLRLLIEEVVAAHFSQVSARGLTLDCTLPSAPVWVSVDLGRFHQIVTNLLTNAIRHSDQGDQLHVRVDIVDDRATLAISDEGQGIDATVLPGIFEPFAQARPGAGGLGLGLSIVRTLVELHGGTVTAASEGQGRGAIFVVTLPVTSAPIPPARTFAGDLRSVAELVRTRAASSDAPLDADLAGIETPLLLADDTSRVTNANRAAIEMTGYTLRELSELHVADILALAGGDVETHWQEFAGAGRQEGILVLLRKDGARVPMRYCAITNVRPGLHLSALDPL